jgi:hypothetical protein
MTWVLVAWTALITVWVIAGVTTRTSKDCTASGVLSQKDCVNASDAGTAIGVGLVVFLGFMGFVVLGMVWYMTRPKSNR